MVPWIRQPHMNAGCEEGTAKNSQIGKSHAYSSLVNKVEVTNSRIEKTLIRRTSYALHDSGTNETAIICPDSPSPCARGDNYKYTDEEQVSLSPNATGRNEENGTSTTSQQKVSCQERDFGEVFGEEERDCDGIGGEDRTECGSKNASEAKEEGYQVASQK
ncbi:hypothetical protein HG531_002420 [Fusarium graminearum]|nr:hypothetical protein HG531_002420 [Fusarium graminearum]